MLIAQDLRKARIGVTIIIYGRFGNTTKTRCASTKNRCCVCFGRENAQIFPDGHYRFSRCIHSAVNRPLFRHTIVSLHLQQYWRACAVTFFTPYGLEAISNLESIKFYKKRPGCENARPKELRLMDEISLFLFL